MQAVLMHFRCRAFCTCGEEKDGAKDCAEPMQPRYNVNDHREDNLLEAIAPEYAASCQFTFRDVDPYAETPICWNLPCVHVDMTW